MLHELAESNYLIVNGYGKGKVYYINNDFLNEDEEIDLTKDETKIIKYIRENEYITNKLSREELHFSKDRSISLFNSLIKKQFIRKEGCGNRVKYVLYR